MSHDRHVITIITQSQFKCLTDMCVDSTNAILITADIEGFLVQWDITAFCIENSKSAKCNKILHVIEFV